jgi:hypothetical protein
MPGFTVTRGLGGSVSNLIARGFVAEVEDELLKRGRSYRKDYIKRYDNEAKRYYEEYNIYVELSAIDGKDLFEPIINKVKYKIKDHDINIVVNPKKLTIKSPDIKINVKMVEKNNVKN